MRKITILAIMIALFAIMHGQIILFEDDLEAGTANWNIVNGAALNRWVHGTGALNNDTNALFVSNSEEGTENPAHAYTMEGWQFGLGNYAGSRVHVWTEIEFPLDALDITLTFDAIVGGQGHNIPAGGTHSEYGYDYLKVYLHPEGFEPEAMNGSYVQGASTQTFNNDETNDNQIGDHIYNLHFGNTSDTEWTTITINIPSAIAAGFTRRLGFTWRNDPYQVGMQGSRPGVQPPAGIDNILITYTQAAAYPAPATLILPFDEEKFVFPTETLRWSVSDGMPPTGYRLYIGTTDPPPEDSEIELGMETTWTSDTPLLNNTTYYWQVVPYNDDGDAEDCPVWSFTTEPLAVVQVGNGTTPNDLPTRLDAGYSYAQSIYLASELENMGGIIAGIKYHYNGNQTLTETIQIYLMDTDREEFIPGEGWIPVESMTLVFDGTITTHNQPTAALANWVSIPFTEEFVHEASLNLIVAVYSYNGVRHGFQNNWLNHAVAPNRTMNYYPPNNTSAFDITDPPDIYMNRTSLPNTRFVFGPAVDGQYLMINPVRLSYWNTRMNIPATYSITMRNIGNQASNVTSIIFPPDMVSNPEPSFVIPAEDVLDLQFILTATELGAYSGEIVINTTAPNAPVIIVPVTGHVYPEDMVYIGDNDSENRNIAIPFDFNYRNSIAQTIYLEEEITVTGSVLLTSVGYRYFGAGDAAPNLYVSIYMATTTNNSFPSNNSWIPFDQFTLVYSGPTPAHLVGMRDFDLLLDTPFEYRSDNLVIMTHRHYSEPTYSGPNTYQVTETTNPRTIYIRNNGTELNIQNVETLTATATPDLIPNIRIFNIPDPYARPQNFHGEAAEGSVTLRWDPPYQEMHIGYTIYKNGREAYTPDATAIDFVDTEVMNNIPYHYYMTAAYPGNNESNPTLTMTFTPEGPVYPPPANLRHTIQTGNNVRLEWSYGEYILDENFETMTLDTQWLSIDADEDSRAWEMDIFDNAEGYQHIRARSIGNNGQALSPENWLISPSFTPTENSFLSYWVGATSQTAFAESYSVRISNNSIDISDFDTSIGGETLTTHEWVRRSINLSEYAGFPIRIAFFHDTEGGQSALKLDGVQVVRPVTPPNEDVVGFKVYKNNVFHEEIENVREYIDTTAETGEHVYHITALYTDGTESFASNIQIVNLVSETEIILPEYTTELKGNYPNPFNPETTIQFTVGAPPSVRGDKGGVNVRIEIYNIKGQKLTTLIDEVHKPGIHNVTWKGTDSSGRPVSSGIYFYRMSTDEYSSVKRMMLVK